MNPVYKILIDDYSLKFSKVSDILIKASIPGYGEVMDNNLSESFKKELKKRRFSKRAISKIERILFSSIDVWENVNCHSLNRKNGKLYLNSI